MRSCEVDKELTSFEIDYKQSHLYVSAEKNFYKEILAFLIKYREDLEKYISFSPEFKNSLTPVEIQENAPLIIKKMAQYSCCAGVGPMASVAGTIAELIGEKLASLSPELIIENGGDIFLRSKKKRIVEIYAGSFLNRKLGIQVNPQGRSIGICTSSGKWGHSLNFGKADAVTVISSSAGLADAVATATANLIKNKDDLENGINFASSIKGIQGVIIVIDKNISFWGKIKFVFLN